MKINYIKFFSFTIAIFLFLLLGFIISFIFWFLEVSSPVKKLNQSQKAYDLNQNTNNTDKIKIEIPKGASTSQIASILYEKNIIKSKLYFKFLAKLYKIEKKLNSGLFWFTGYESPNDIIQELTKNDIKLIKVTIPEGITNKEIAEILEKNNVILSAYDFINLVNNKAFINSIFKGWNIQYDNAEGLLFPETYFFAPNSSLEEVATTMFELTYHIFNKLSAGKKLILDPYKTCILASIIECEAKKDDERPIIASVFYNRLKINMKLESCSTIQYILANSEIGRKKQLTYADLKVNSPYNTYIYNGLPPTPISNFGKKSLLAAIHPAQTDFLFFVSDGDGGHIFSTNIKDHNINKQIYKKNLQTKLE